ncbi:alpha/beta fold hydrolase [Dactylosporangium sp. CA-092794]|uniref:alpha/beta fold hydrolase n=1 Tax=Dactylosporangium sp. CA-092794 TaxID=3239929 RepID=UPI003D8D2120
MTDAQPWTLGYTRRQFTVGGGSISWLELDESKAAAGVPIVMVHGMQACALDYCELGRLLGRRGPVYLLDLRGHGHSSAAPDNPIAGSMADQVDVVVAFLREIVGRPAVVVGNSFGAMICARVARVAPGDVHRLVLIGPAMTPSRAPLNLTRTLQWLVQKPRLVRKVYDDDVRSGKRREDPDGLKADVVPNLDLIPAAYRQAIRAEPEPAWSVGNPDGRRSLWRGRNDVCQQLSRPRMLNDLLNALTTPGLWLHGIDDPLMPAVPAEALRRLLPGWDVEVVGETGHEPHLERVEWTSKCIDAWLGRAVPGGG